MSTPAEFTQRAVVVGTAGHIDHGKTMLVRALTGVDTDRLPEEKRRGITVDLGFATVELETAAGARLRLDLIDVPGHKQFVRNMLAGAGGIDFVMLVIAANEGVMPQTEEHLAICELLGVRRGITVLTKADLVSEEQLGVVCEEVRTALESSFLSDAPILPVSAQSGYGMAALRSELARVAEAVPVRSAAGLPRLPIDRSFVMKGFGTVVTGTLHSGSVSVGQMLMLDPGGKEVRVRGLQRQGRSQNKVYAGSRVALNLAGVEVAEVRRGATLVLPKTLEAVAVVDAEVLLLPDAPELRHRMRVRLHSFTSESVATVSLYGDGAVAAGSSRVVRLKLASPVLLVPGDRFVLRRLSPAQTIGGGRVLDAHPLARTPRKKALAVLDKLRGAGPAEQLRLRVERRGTDGVTLPQLAQEMGWPLDATLAAVQPLITKGPMQMIAHQLLISGDALDEAGDRLLKLVGTSPKTLKARGFSELRSDSQLPAEVFRAVLEALVQQRKLAVRGEAGHELVSAAGVKLDSPDRDQAKLAALAELYRRAALDPPLFAEAIRELRLSEKEVRGLMTLLLRDRTLVKVGAEDVFMHRAAVEGLEQTIRRLKNQTLDVARFKQITGLTRKYAIPLLEYLDRQRITRRQGETRIVL